MVDNKSSNKYWHYMFPLLYYGYIVVPSMRESCDQNTLERAREAKLDTRLYFL